MRLVDGQLFPHHGDSLILGSDPAVFKVLGRSFDAQEVKIKTKSSSSTMMTLLLKYLADGRYNERRANLLDLTSRL